jgi:arginine decarboxylase
LNQKYILLAINKWDDPYHKVNMGGLTCDSMDYYNSEAHTGEVFLPMINDEEPLYIGFFHTGAYQESLGGYGGIQHCLVPAPKHVLIDRNEDGEVTTKLFAGEQSSESMLRVLGYDTSVGSGSTPSPKKEEPPAERETVSAVAEKEQAKT